MNIDILQLHTKDQYLGKAGREIVLTVDTNGIPISIFTLLKTEWLMMPLLRVISIKDNPDYTKLISCVLQTGDANSYIPTEYLDPTAQVNRDRIPLEIITLEDEIK